MASRQKPRKKKQNPKTTQAENRKVPSSLAEIHSEVEKRGWGQDLLTKKIEHAFCNIGVSFLELKPYFELLIKAAEIFEDTSKLLSYLELDELISVSLFARAYSCFFAAVRLSCSGQITEMWVLLRACLENSLYAFYISENPELAKVWTERHDNEDTKRKCKKAFVVKNIWNDLEAKSKSIAKEAKSVYEQSIDWGAHPNERTLFPNLVEKPEGSGFNLQILNPNLDLMRASLTTIVFTADVVFRIFALIFPDEFQQPNLALKISNLRRSSKPFMAEVARRLAPNG